jgi:membrane protease YdiL (CAAX protease family)
MAFVVRRETNIPASHPESGGSAQYSNVAGRPLPDVPTQEKRQRWFELCLVLLLACGSFVLNGIYLLKHGPGAMTGFSNVRWSVGILQEAGCLMLVGYVLSRRRLRFADLGLHWSLRGVGMGLLVAMIGYVVYGIGSVLIQTGYRQMFGHMATTPRPNQFFGHPSLMFIPFSLLNPFFEELIIRAYLMTEVAELTGSSALAVIASVAVQFSYHLYYGWVGAISVSFLFLVFALYYVRTRQALPVIVAHGLFDVYGLIRFW